VSTSEALAIAIADLEHVRARAERLELSLKAALAEVAHLRADVAATRVSLLAAERSVS
jgi:hypothetical protein